MHLWSRTSFLFFWSLFFSCSVVAQDLTIRSTWKDPTSNLSRSDRAQIAQNAIAQLIPLIDSTEGTIDTIKYASTAASLFAVLALNDWINGETTYKNITVSNIQKYFSLHPNFIQYPFQLNSDSVLWGLTAYYTFRAYNHPSSLSTAVDVWDYASQYLITDAQVEAGSQPTRNFTLPSQCNGSSVAGGVFWFPAVPGDGGVNGETVGPFLALSAYLAEATSNSTYLLAAELSATFIRDHMYNGTIVMDSLDVKSCQISAADYVFTYDSGFVIEGYSVLGNVTKNSTWTTLAENLVATSAPFSAWTGQDGVVIEGNDISSSDLRVGYKGLFIRALHEVWYRSDPGSDVARFIESFLTVQFNSIQAHATIPGSNVYSPFWAGPTGSFDSFSQITTLYALNSVISLAQPVANGTASGSSLSPSPSASASPSPVSSTPSSSHTGAKAGGVVGGVIGALAIVGAAVLIRRRRSRRPLSEPQPVHDYSQVINPFISQLPPVPDMPGAPTAMTSTNHKRAVTRRHFITQTMSTDTDAVALRSVPLETQAEVAGVETTGGDDPVWMRRIMEGVLTRMRLEIAPLRDEAPPPQYEG